MGKPVGSVLDLRQVASPGAPAAGISSLYSKSDSGIYVQSSVLAEMRLLTDADDIGGENLANNPSFELASAGGGVLGTATRYSLDTTQFTIGTQSLKIAPLAGDTGNIGWRGDFKAIGVADGLSFIVSADLHRAAGAGNFQMQLEWGDASQVSLGVATTTIYNTTILPAGSWLRRNNSVVIAPANTRYARVRFYFSSYVGGTDVVNIDAIQIERGTVATGFKPPMDDMLGMRMQNLADPTAAQDAVTRNYAGLTYAPISGSANYAPSTDPHLFRDVKAVQTANVSLASATVTVDGVTLVAGERVLLTAQTAPAENGIYTVGTVSAGNAPLTRDTHFNTSLLLANAGVIETTHGTTYGGTAWLTTFKATDTLGTTAMNWYRVTDASYLPLAALLNSSGAAQTFSAGTETYVTGSQIVIPTSRMKVGTVYRCRMNISKTAAGTATWNINGRLGTAGTTADTAVVTASVAPAQTAAIDVATVEVEIVFTAVGASGGCKANFTVIHNLAATGFIGTGSSSFTATGASGLINTTTAGLKLGVSIAPGASAIYTVNFVETELLNLV